MHTRISAAFRTLLMRQFASSSYRATAQKSQALFRPIAAPIGLATSRTIKAPIAPNAKSTMANATLGSAIIAVLERGAISNTENDTVIRMSIPTAKDAADFVSLSSLVISNSLSAAMTRAPRIGPPFRNHRDRKIASLVSYLTRISARSVSGSVIKRGK